MKCYARIRNKAWALEITSKGVNATTVSKNVVQYTFYMHLSSMYRYHPHKAPPPGKYQFIWHRYRHLLELPNGMIGVEDEVNV